MFNSFIFIYLFMIFILWIFQADLHVDINFIQPLIFSNIIWKYLMNIKERVNKHFYLNDKKRKNILNK